MSIHIIKLTSGELQIPTTSVEKLKQQARKLKRENELSHSEALDAIAQKHGFHHWHHVTLSNQVFGPVEQAIKHGCAMAIDRKDGEGIDTSDGTLVSDDLGLYAAYDQVFRSYSDSIDEEDESQRPWKELLSPEDLKESFHEFFGSMMIFRMDESHWQKSLSEIKDIIHEYSFFPADYIWLRGTLYDVYDQPFR